MRLVGIVGGVASGKSTVANCLKEQGAVVLDADAAGHETLRLPNVIAALRQRWGDGILDAAGQINRSAVAKIVFAASGIEEKRFLESVTHPHIHDLLKRRLTELKHVGGAHAAILDAALLFEAGWDNLCDFVLFVETPRAQRLERARTRGWSEADFVAREAAQMSLDEKRRRCGFVIDNSGHPDQTRQQVREFWRLNIGPTDH